jgi:hypothetical protein
MLQTIVKDHQFVSLLAPYFTPNVSIEQFGKLYEVLRPNIINNTLQRTHREKLRSIF